jgi:hypothetical protein
MAIVDGGKFRYSTDAIAKALASFKDKKTVFLPDKNG